jgi:hypothetical protein
MLGRSLNSLNSIKSHTLPFKNFSSNLKVKEIKPIEKSKIEMKDFFFKYHNIEYRSQIPKNIDQSIKDFLDHFGKDRSVLTKEQLGFKDFEMSRGGKYLPINLLLNNINTKSEDTSPVFIHDDKLTLNNIRFRNLDHLRHPYEASSQSLQTFLNEFIETVSINHIDSEFIKTLIKTLKDFRDNQSKMVIAVGSLFEKVKNLDSNEKINLDFVTNYSINLKSHNKRDKSNIFLLENRKNNISIPINLVLSHNEEEKVRNFDQAIVDNFDSLRKFSLAKNSKFNFGIVTDFHNWKINFYRRNENGLVENSKDYLTSLKYNLTVTSDFVNEANFLILMKVLYGVINLDETKLQNVKF